MPEDTPVTDGLVSMDEILAEEEGIETGGGREGDTPTPGEEKPDGDTTPRDGGDKDQDAEDFDDIPGVIETTPEAEDSADDEDGPPDLAPDEDFKAYLAKHPELKARYEAFVANKERGIQKWMERQKAKAPDPQLVGLIEALKSPETADAAFADLCEVLTVGHGRPFGSVQPTSSAADSSRPSDGAHTESELWDIETPDQIKARWFKEFSEGILAPALDKIIATINPVTQTFQTQLAKAETAKTAAAALPEIKKLHETEDDPWVTQELVEQAIEALPEIARSRGVKTAFRMFHVDTIARKVAQYAASRNPKPGEGAPRNLPAHGVHKGGRQASELGDFCTMQEIFETELV